MNKKEKIFLNDLKNKNIYLRLEKDSQNQLFSKFTSKELEISYTLFSSYKLKNHAFPLDLFLKIINKLNMSEIKFYKNIVEIKYGERSTPILKPKFPIIKDPIYWNILFALFCDGTSDRWSEQYKKRIRCPAYTSYSKEILSSFINIVKTKFGNFNYKINDGTVRIPLIIDTIFRIQHKINSFNTKSNKIPKFILSKEFEYELRHLNKLNKIAILIRYLVDEGDKSKISLDPRTIELGISNTSKHLVKIIKNILIDLKLKHNIVRRERQSRNKKWKNAYQVKISRGYSRSNLKKLNYYLNKIYSKYKLITLTKIQSNSLKKSVTYKYKKPLYEESHSKTIQYLIKQFLLTKNITNIREVNNMLIFHGYYLNRNSISYLLRRMPIEIRKNKKRNIIYVNKNKLKSYIPYTKEQIIKVSLFQKAKKMYKAGKKISFISNKLKIPWATIKSWVNGKCKPAILHGPWIKEI